MSDHDRTPRPLFEPSPEEGGAPHDVTVDPPSTTTPDLLRDRIKKALTRHRLGHAEGDDGERLLLSVALTRNPGSGAAEIELLADAIAGDLE